MDSKRSIKARSVGTESRSSQSSKSGRPDLGDRVNSDPSIAPRRQSHTKIVESSAKSSLQNGYVAKTRREDARSPTDRTVPLLSKTSGGVSSKSGGNRTETLVSLAVIGAEEVGKTSFIDGVFNARRSATGSCPSGKVSLEGVVYRFHMLEMSFEDIEFRRGSRILWPKTLSKSPVPAIDGVLCLYDVTDEDSIAELPDFLSALCSSSTPCVVAARKCDAPFEKWQVGPRFAAKVASHFPAVKICESSAKDPDSDRRCLLAMLKLILTSSDSASNKASKMSGLRHTMSHEPNVALNRLMPQARSKSELFGSSKTQIQSSRTGGTRPGGAEADSPVSHDDQSEQVEDDDIEDATDEESIGEEPKTRPPVSREKLVLDTDYGTNRQPWPSEPQTPISASGILVNNLASPSEGHSSGTPQTPESLYMTSVLRPGTADTNECTTSRTFLDIEEESQDESPVADIDPQQLALEKLQATERYQGESGSSFDQLIDQLLMLPQTKQQVKFVPIFLCLYRAFATPFQLLTRFISRFEAIEKSRDVSITKAGEQLRYLQVLAEWTAGYPGDFSKPSVRSTATKFVAQLSKSKIFKGAATEISNNLSTVVKDDDLDWAFSAKRASQTPESHSSASARLGSPTKAEAVQRRTSESDGASDDVYQEDELDSPTRVSDMTSSVSSLVRTKNASSQSLANLLVLESAREKAQKLRPVPRNRLSKIQWHQFIDTPAVDIAMEITQIDWTMFTAIRPREFVRHVCLSTEKKRRSHLADNIGMMVKHFNHLALFVSGMILLRDKPKHRAKALEKWMAVAWKIRQMNNYNSLGAIVAGINGPEIQRLSTTRDLVPPAVQKDFLRLTILMSHSRSHAAYRMAWENSSAERIPFIPLLRQDLTRAQLGNRTFIGEDQRMIHWKKFVIMGEVILGIQKSQQQPYAFGARDPETAKLILETRVLDGSEDSADPRDELQKRSEEVEPTGGMIDSSRKKFDWFRR